MDRLDTVAPARTSAHWSQHRGLSILLRSLVAVLPVALSIILTLAASRLLPTPSGIPAVVIQWVLLSLLSTGVLVGLRQVARRMMPLTTMAGLALVFPDRVPSRMGMALRTGSVTELDARLHRARMLGATGTESEAAGGLLELVCDLGSHDRSTRGHAERTRALSQLIGEEMGLSAQDRDLLNWSALLHDIGKLDVPRQVLGKAEPLDDVDRALIRGHVPAGARLVRPLEPWLGPWLAAVAEHHERWDGQGYPKGLAGEEIALSARIVTVADAFDAMTEPGAGRERLTPAEARAELTAGAGTQFDPEVVRAFLAIGMTRLRVAMGPLSWLVNLPIVGRVPITPAIAGVFGSAVAATALFTGGAGTGAGATPRALPPAVAAPAPDDVPDLVDLPPPAPTPPTVRSEPPPPLDPLAPPTPDAPSPPPAPDPDPGPPTAPDPPPPAAQSFKVTVNEDESVEIDLGDPAGLSLVSGVDHGALVGTGPGTVRYTPHNNFNGADGFTYQRCGPVLCATGTVHITVHPVNDDPVAVNDSYTGREDDGPMDLNVAVNDTDIDGDPRTVSGVSATVGGTAAVLPNGRVRFTPHPDFNGTASLIYRLSDGNGGTGTATATIALTPVNDPPSFTAGSDDSTPEDSGAQSVTAWATGITEGPGDESAQTLSFAVVADDPSLFSTQPAVTPSGTLTYRPAADANGITTITLTARDNGGTANGGIDTSAGQIAHITISPQPDRPAAADDRYGTPEDTLLSEPAPTGLLANDADVDGDTLTVNTTPVTPPTDGTLTLHGDGSFDYDPDPAFNGTDTFTYEIDDGTGRTDSATVTISVGSVPDPPVAGDDTFSMLEEATLNEPALTGLLANDSDLDGDPLTVNTAPVRPPSDGSLTLHADGSFDFSPDADFVGDDSFVYEIDDGTGRTDTATVSITVGAVNDPPEFTAGADESVLEDAGAQTVSGWATAISPGPADESAQSVSFTAAADDPSLFSTQPTLSPTGELTYTPAPDASGVALVTVTAVDDGGTADGGVDTSPGQVLRIEIGAVNDPPEFIAGTDESVLEDAGAQTVPGWATGISAGPANESGQAVMFTVTADDPSVFSSQPAISQRGDLTYTPAPDANGTALVTVNAVDDGGGDDTSADHVLSITVGAVNDPPEFTAGADESVLEDAGAQTVSGWATAISPGPADESGQSVTFNAVADAPSLFSTQPTLSPTGELTYTPAPDASGVALVTVTAVDDGGTADGGDDTGADHALTITVIAVPEAPVAVDDSESVAEDDTGGVTFDVFANDSDPDDDPLLLFGWDDTALVYGALVHNGAGEFTYTPAPEESGVDTFTYVLTDGKGGFDTGTVSVTIQPRPDAPQARSDSYLAAENVLKVVPAPGVLSNDGDVDGDPLTVDTTPVTPPVNGSVVLRADGSFDYTPDNGFKGYDGFTYRVDDGTGLSDVASVTIVVDDTLTSYGWYMGDTGSGPDAFDLVTSPLPASVPPADVDGDTAPGLTLKSTGRSAPKPDESDPAKYQYWDLAPTSPLILQGSLHVELWSTIADFKPDKTGHPYFWVSECADDGTDCTLLLANDFHIDPWNTGVSDWVFRDLTLGAIDTTINPGRMLRVRMSSKHDDLWVAMTQAMPSRVAVVPTGPGALVSDAFVMPEDAPATNLDILANDDPGVAPGSVALTTQPEHGLVALQPDGTVDYTPDPEWWGEDTFDYLGCNAFQCGITTVTVTVTSVLDAPYAAPDAYVTAGRAVLPVKMVVAKAQGVLVNDTDADDDGLSVTTSPVTAPRDGTLTLRSDGSFDYTPDAGFFGVDTFEYEVVDGTGRTDRGLVTITVTAPVTQQGLWLGDRGTSADDWDLVDAPLADVDPPPDTDGDGDPGLTIERSTGDVTDTDGGRFQHWSYEPSSPWRLSGPVTLDLWDAFADFDKDEDARIYVWLSECADDGTDCNVLSATEYFQTEWNTAGDYRAHHLDLGHVDATIPVGRELRLRVMYDHDDFWLPLTLDQPSKLTVTTRYAVDDYPNAVNEDVGVRNLVVLANDVLFADPTTVSIVDPPTHGTAVPRPDGTIDWRPDPEWWGADTFTYRVCDTDGGCAPAPATVHLDVKSRPDNPYAAPDAYVTAGRAVLPVKMVVAKAQGVLVNDTDADDDGLSVTTSPVTAPRDGTLTLRSDGSFDYTPDAGFFGVDTFEYEVVDGTGRTDRGLVTITVTAPVTQQGLWLGDRGTSADDWDLVDAPLADVDPPPDTDGDGDPGLTIERSTGDVTDTDGGRFQHWSYEPSSPWRLSGPVTLDLWDAFADFDKDEDARIYVWLSECADDGTDCNVLSATEYFQTEWNTAGDYRAHHLDLGHVDATIPVGRELRLRVMYDHDDFWLPLTLDQPSKLTVTTRYAVDDYPNAVNEDVGVRNLVVLANDVLFADPTTVSIVDPPTHGTAVPRPDGTIDWRPDPEWWGADTFTYRVCDTDGGCAPAPATVHLDVKSRPDNPYAAPDAYVTAGRAVLPVKMVVAKAQGVLVNDTDADDDGLSVTTSPVTAPRDGTLTLRSDGSFDYTPDAGFFGVDTFEYEVVDGTGRTDRGLVTITVTAPVTQQGLWLGDRGTSADDWDLVDAPLADVDPPPDTDGDGDPGLTIERSTGDVTDTDGGRFQHWSYEPSSPWRLSGPVTLDLWDAFADFDKDEDARIYVWLSECADDGTDCNVLSATEYFQTEWNTAGDYRAHHLDLGHVDATIPVGRELRLRVMYDHDDFWLPLTLDQPSKLTVTHKPVAQDDVATVTEDSSVNSIDVLANDVPGANPTSVSVQSQSHGIAVARPDGTVDYTPDAEWYGTDTFTYRVCDNVVGYCSVATVTVDVTPVPDDPMAAPDGYVTTKAPTILSVNKAKGLLANDTDADDDGLDVAPQPLSGPSHGTLIADINGHRITKDGKFTYLPDDGFTGTDTFTYEVDDGTGRTDQAAVTIRVVTTVAQQDLYLGDSGTSGDDWDLVAARLPNVTPSPDTDGDGDPGLTITRSTGRTTDTDGDHYQHWSFEPTSPLVLRGPVTLDLWDAFADLDQDEDARIFVRLHDCADDGTDCNELAALDYFETVWNKDPTYRSHLLNLGDLDTTIAVGRELRLRVMYDHDDFWLPLTRDLDSVLTITTP